MYQVFSMLLLMKFNWGSHAWKFLHAVTFAYPDDPGKMTKIRYLTFFKLLRYVLPCSVCREGYSTDSHDLTLATMKNRDTLSRWLVTVHNRVNRRIGKKIQTYDMVVPKYLSAV